MMKWMMSKRKRERKDKNEENKGVELWMEEMGGR